MKSLPHVDDLLPGDVFLYRPSEIIGRIIAIKTWTWLSHTEGYIGNGQSVGARLEGSKIWPVRLDKYLKYVRRPKTPFNVAAAMAAKDVQEMLNESYEAVSGFWSFFSPLMKHYHNNRICSVLVTVWLRAGGVQPFNPALAADDVAPAQLWQTEELQTIWEA